MGLGGVEGLFTFHVRLVTTARPSMSFRCIRLLRKYGFPEESGRVGSAASSPLGSICIAASRLAKKLLLVMIAWVPSCASGLNRVRKNPPCPPPEFNGVERLVSVVTNASTDWVGRVPS